MVSRESVSDLGLVRAKFANGVALTIKPTKLRQDQVLVSVRVGHGRLDLPRDRPSLGWALGAVVAGGFGKLDFEDAQAALAGKVHSANLSLDDTAFQFTGATRPEDFGTELEYLTAYLADPGFRSEGFARLRTAYLAELPQLDATPDGVLGREQGALFTGGDPRFAFPTASALKEATPAAWRAQFKPPLTQGPVEVTIVGDVDPEKTIAEVARTFGALPKREPLENVSRVDLGVRFPAPPPTPVRFSDTGREDQAVAVVAWPETDFFADMHRSRADMLAGEVFENRLLDQVRVAEGATYSPETEVELSQSIPGYGFALAQVEMPPARIPGFFDAAAKIARDMAQSGVSQDELARARTPRVAGLPKAQLTNEYWLGRPVGSHRRSPAARPDPHDFPGLRGGDRGRHPGFGPSLAGGRPRVQGGGERGGRRLRGRRDRRQGLARARAYRAPGPLRKYLKKSLSGERTMVVSPSAKRALIGLHASGRRRRSGGPCRSSWRRCARSARRPRRGW